MIIEGYKNSPYHEKAMLRSAEATHKQYVGPSYDTVCLDEALVRYKQYQLNFPEKAQQLDIVGRIGLIRQQQALKCFETADFYQRTGRDQAAEKYRRIVVEQWPETEFAAESQKLLDKN